MESTFKNTSKLSEGWYRSSSPVESDWTFTDEQVPLSFQDKDLSEVIQVSGFNPSEGPSFTTLINTVFRGRIIYSL